VSLEIIHAAAQKVADELGVSVDEVSFHPSGALILRTSVGKGYLPDDTNIEDPAAFVDAVHSTLQMMKDIADGAFDPYVHTDEETSELVLEPGSVEDDVAAMSIEPEAPKVKTPKQRKSKADA
jgi:hypothetical protein